MLQTETNIKSSYGEFFKNRNEHGCRREVTGHCAAINVIRSTAQRPMLTQPQVLRRGIPTACFFRYSPKFRTAGSAIGCYAAMQPQTSL